MRTVLAIGVLTSLALAACTPAAPPSPTAAPPKPAATTAPAKPAATAPAKPAEKPTEKPAAKPTEKPAAKAAAFDEKAVADFYRGKTIRMVIGFAPGGATDTNARMVQKVLGKHIPGNPTVVPENKPGGGGLLVANTVYNSEPKDGTVIAA
ncbi:MAG: hypothetical protein HY690_17900, partial [Chloroflexi bacterium]|nr:hypothetical protein [Chloroflexota bacterium]